MKEKKHGLAGRPSNRTLSDSNQRLQRRTFSENDEFWPLYQAEAEKAGMKVIDWMRQVLRDKVS